MEQAFLLQQQLQGLLEKDGFLLRKWRSNSTDVLDSIPQELKESTAAQPIVQEDTYHKTLGIHWDSDNNIFYVSTSQEAAPFIPTNRGLVSDIARTYDVLGLFAPSIVVMKIFLQKLWEAYLDWDEEVSQDIQFKHLAWREQIPLLWAEAIPRYYFVDSYAVDIELNSFSDASESAYAAMVYFRAIQPSGEPTVTLVTAKSKVAPLKRLSMPRLELCGAYLLSKLIH